MRGTFGGVDDHPCTRRVCDALVEAVQHIEVGIQLTWRRSVQKLQQTARPYEL